MLLKILKTKQPVLLILIPIITIILWLKGFVSHDIKNLTSLNYGIEMPLYKLISPVINFNIISGKIIGIILVLLQAFLLAALNMKFFFIKQRTYLHTFTFILIASSSLFLQYASPALIANFFIIFAFDWLFSSYKKYNTNKELFNSGLFLGIATMFYFNTAFILPFFIIAYLILHTGRIREILILLTGFLTPVAIFTEIALLQGTLNPFLQEINNFFEKLNYHYSFFSKSNIFYSYLIALVIITLLKFFSIIGTKKIASRKIFSIFFLYIIFLLTTLFIIPVFDFQILIILAVPVTYFITDYYINIKNSIISEISFLLLVASLILTQFVIF